MKNRVYGVLSIETKNNVFNADFNGMPRQNSKGEYFSSDKAYKYACRRYWVDNDQTVFYFKSYKEMENKSGKQILPKNLEERYIELFNEIPKDNDLLISNALTCIDIKNFGTTLTLKGNNFSITGVAQINNGINKMEETSTYTLELLSPFQDSTKSEAKNNTLGSKTIVDEAHYFYDLIVNPKNLNNFNKYGEYTEKDYLLLKEGLMKGVTGLNTQTKINSNNEFGIFIKLKEESKLYLPCLSEYIDFNYKDKEKNEIDLSKLSNIIERNKNEIENVEIIYNDFTLELTNVLEIIEIKSIFEI